MRNRFYIAIILILIPLTALAQASGGQIRRHSHTQQTEHSNVNRQRTTILHNRDNTSKKSESENLRELPDEEFAIL